MQSYWFPKHYSDEAQRLRVPLGFVMVALFGWYAQPTAGSLKFGLPLAFLGVLIRAWAAGHLAKNEELVSSGPYAYTRNPLYVGTFLSGVGFSAASREPWLAVLFIAAFVLVYVPAMELEEQHLRTLFPAYARYASQVPMLIPRLRPIPAGGRFRGSLYWRNQEYNALGAYLAGTLWLAWRAGLVVIPW